MAVCETCGNDYHSPLKIVMDGRARIFDCFECAISALAPHCDQCGVPIIGHGAEMQNQFFCCNHCARKSSRRSVRDTTSPLRI